MMNVRSALFAVAALAATCYASRALFRWAADGNRDLAALAREVQRGEELEPHLGAGLRRYQAERALAAEVVAGRMSLREAAGHFRLRDEADPIWPPGIPHPARDEQALCERVLHLVWEILAEEKRFAAAARWYAEAFTAHPQVFAGPPTKHHYHATCAAAMAGCGQGRDAADLNEKTRVGLRRQARDWLRAELEARRRLLEQEPAKALIVARDLLDWQRDSHFAGVRGPNALARLPEAERQACQKLWADAADTLARAQGTTAAEPKAENKVQPSEQ
jgi:hypothetical protein